MSFRKTISWCLFPLTMWYAIGVAFRNLLFSLGIKRQVAPEVTTIGVGNLCAGGTGKTPHVEYLLRLLSDKYPTAMLSRGYQRKSHGFVLADSTNNTARQLGDEPAMIAAKYPQVITAVCEKRLEGVNRLLKLNTPPQVVVLDDVFQHRYVKPTINILLTEFGNPFFQDSIMPYGNLREFRSARSRANIIIVTKSPEVLSPIDKHNITQALKVQPYQKVFFSYMRYCDPLPLMGNTPLPLMPDDEVLVLTGIANPQPMLQYLNGKCKVTSMVYPDHHAYTANDVKRIRKSFEQLGGSRKYILTTEKDAARLRDLATKDVLTGLPIYYLPIEVCMHQSQDFNFDTTISNLVKENILFRTRMSTAKFNF